MREGGRESKERRGEEEGLETYAVEEKEYR